MAGVAGLPARGLTLTVETCPHYLHFAAEEIRDANLETGTAYEAIARLRPNWLTRGTESNGPLTTELARVFVDGRPYGELESLRDFNASQIAHVRYYSVAEAGKFGLEGGLSGVIEIATKK